MKAECAICEHSQEAPPHGNWTCEYCGQKYEYEEGHMIVLTKAQLEALRCLKISIYPFES